MNCDVCNCPLIILRTATGRKERRNLCARCREDESVAFQVGMLEEHAKALEPERPVVSDKPMGQVLRIDQYLKTRGKRKQLLM